MDDTSKLRPTVALTSCSADGRMGANASSEPISNVRSDVVVKGGLCGENGTGRVKPITVSFGSLFATPSQKTDTEDLDIQQWP